MKGEVESLEQRIRTDAETVAATDTGPMPKASHAPPRTVVAERPFSLPAPASAKLLGQILADRYLIIRQLGSGGMGTVFEAEHVHMKKRVAVKILHGSLTRKAEVVARFEREAIVAARIQHPNVAMATDFGQLEDGSFYLVLELIEGESLASRLGRQAKLEPGEACQIAMQIALALSAAHEANVVHRDLKPENVMLVPNPEGLETVKVLDFGIAKLYADDGEGAPKLTSAGSVFGTPQYMSPEQATGSPVSARSDLYALGVMLFEMLSGGCPFNGPDVMTVLRAQILEPPPPLPPELPRPLDLLIRQLLAKEPGVRPALALTVYERLADIAVAQSWPMPALPAVVGTRLDLVVASRRQLGMPLPGAQGSSQGAQVLASLRSLSMHPVSVGKLRLPLYGAALLLLSACLLLSYWVLRGSQNEPAATVGPAPISSQQRAEQQLLEAAERGDRDSLSELRRWVEAERGQVSAGGPDQLVRHVNRLLALGHGYAQIHLTVASLEAYSEACNFQPELAARETIQSDLRAALAKRDSLALAAELLLSKAGSRGADLVYDAYREQLELGKASSTLDLLSKWVSGEKIFAVASPALQANLRLIRAQSCQDEKAVLEDLVRIGDERALSGLRELTRAYSCTKERGCQQCMRGSELQLTRALEAARARPAPVLPRANGG